MYEVSIRQHFDAAHYLRDYNGKCENLHGHRYEVAVTLRSQALNSTGLAFDFTLLKRILKERYLDKYDHVCLNDISPYDEINPSAENIARTMYEGLKTPLADQAGSLFSVTVWESPDSWCTYSET